VSVRLATAEDALGIAEVHVASWRAAYRGLLPDDVIESRTVARRFGQWRRIVADSSQRTWVYEEDGRVVAFANLGPCRDPDKDAATVAELNSLYALESVWGNGVGWALWQALHGYLLGSPYREVTLWVLTENARARRFYERLGFEMDGCTKLETWREGATLQETRYARGVGG
jgi:RimJ/RimL family protein N-acetyltransferase